MRAEGEGVSHQSTGSAAQQLLSDWLRWHVGTRSPAKQLNSGCSFSRASGMGRSARCRAFLLILDVTEEAGGA